MSSRWSKAVLPMIGAAMLVFGIYHVVHSQQKFAIVETTPPANPARNPFGRTVAASGIVEARSENIQLGAAIAGVVLERYVGPERVGERVELGEPLFLVDDRQARADLKYHEANLAAAEAELSKLAALPRVESVPPSEAKVQVHEANLALMFDQYERGRKLISSNAIPAEELMGRELRYKAAQQHLAQAKAEHDLLLAGAWSADRAIATANVELAKTQVEKARTEVERALVRSPIAGHVLQVNVRPGEYVGPSVERAHFVVGDLSKLHVRANVDEHDIPRFRRNAPAKAYIRGDAERAYSLRFVRLEPYVVPKTSLTGDNTERVDTRVLQVIYEVDESECELLVGQQVDVFVDLE